MAPITRTAPSRRSLLPAFDDLEDADPFGVGRLKLASSRPALTPELHAANARFADAILGTGNYDDAARTVLSDLEHRGEPAAQSLRNVLDQLHERDPGAAVAFAGSVRRLADSQPSSESGTDRADASPGSTSNLKRTIGHYLFPGQVAVDDENPWAEAGADLVPLWGNLRSASYAAQDIENAIAAAREGDYLGAAGHGAWALFDGAGAIPGPGNLVAAGKPLIRNALRATPGVRRAHASWTLAKAARQFDNPVGVTLKELYGDFWSKLSPAQRKKLKGLQGNIKGYAGESYNDELLTSSGFKHQGDGEVFWGNPKGAPRKFDAETAEKFDTIFFGLLAVPGKSSGSRMLYELKTAGSELTDLQKKADAIIAQSDTIQYLRLHLDQVPFEFLAAQTRKYLQKPGAPFAPGEIEQLVKSMRRARTPDGKPLSVADWIMSMARVGADMASNDSDETD